MASINSAAVINNVAPGDSLKTGADKINAHWHEYEGAKLTNSAAGSTAVGDVLALSSQTAVLGDTQGSLQSYVVAMAVIANAVVGEFARAGTVSAKASGAIAAMQYIRKSATARAVEDAGVAVGATASAPVGTIGFALAAAAGGFVTMMLFPETASPLESGTWGAPARNLGVIYQNTSGKKRRVVVNCYGPAPGVLAWHLDLDSASPPATFLSFTGETEAGGTTRERGAFTVEVPNNWYYRAVNDANATIDAWKELDE